MEIAYHTVNLDLTREDRRHVEAEVARVESFIRNFPDPMSHITLERSLRKGGVGAGVKIALPTKTLFATAWGGDVRSAMQAAADKLVRQAKRHLDVLRREERAGADSLRQAGEMPPAPVEDFRAARDLEDFRDRVADHAARLHDLLLRERKLDPRAREVRSAISVPDLVDDAVAYVFEHFGEKPEKMTPDRWLARRGLLFLDQEIERAHRERTEAPAPPPPEAPEEDWQELFELDLPFLPPDPMDGRAAAADGAAPDRVGARAEAQRATAAALQALPDRQRLAVTLMHLEGYDAGEVAYVLNSTEDQVEDWVAQAEITLRERLADWGAL